MANVDPLSVDTHDQDQLHEIALVAELMIACSYCPQERLPLDELDAVLGTPTGG